MHLKRSKDTRHEETLDAIPAATSDENPNKRRRCICLSTIFVIIFIGLLTLILALTVFKFKKPTTTINSIILKDVNVSLNLIPPWISINVSLDMTISIKNPNKVGIKYQNSSATLRYEDHDIGNVPIPAGKIDSDDTKQVNLTLTIFADRLLTNFDIYGDVVSGNLPVSTYTRISGKVRILNLFNVHVVSTSTCNLKIDILNRRIANEKCHYKNKL